MRKTVVFQYGINLQFTILEARLGKKALLKYMIVGRAAGEDGFADAATLDEGVAKIEIHEPAVEEAAVLKGAVIELSGREGGSFEDTIYKRTALYLAGVYFRKNEGAVLEIHVEHMESGNTISIEHAPYVVVVLEVVGSLDVASQTILADINTGRYDIPPALE